MFPYYCQKPDGEYGPDKKFNSWDNRDFFIVSTFTLSFVSFMFSWFIHKVKAGSKTKGFNKKKWMKRIKNGWFQNNEVQVPMMQNNNKEENNKEKEI